MILTSNSHVIKIALHWGMSRAECVNDDNIENCLTRVLEYGATIPPALAAMEDTPKHVFLIVGPENQGEENKTMDKRVGCCEDGVENGGGKENVQKCIIYY